MSAGRKRRDLASNQQDAAVSPNLFSLVTFGSFSLSQLPTAVSRLAWLASFVVSTPHQRVRMAHHVLFAPWSTSDDAIIDS